jgi:hypothetical protein
VTRGDESETRTRRRQIADFEWHWDGAFIMTGWENGKFTTTYAANGEEITGGDITDLRAAALHYYSSMHADHTST